MIALIPVLVLNSASLFLKDKLKTSGMNTYFILFMLSLNMLYFASLVNLLKPAAVLIYVFLLVITVLWLFECKKNRVNPLVYAQQEPWLVLNNVSCIVFAVIFSIKKPGIYYWDEFNLWAPSAKAVKLFDRLYSVGINPSTNDRNYPPGNAILNYFISFFDLEFREYILLLSYAILFIGCFSAAAAAIYKITDNFAVSAGCWLLFVLSPFMTAYHSHSVRYTSLSYAYGTTMVDFNLAVVFMAAVAMYFSDRKRKWHLLPLIYLVTIKKNGIFFALLAFCIISCFELFTFKEKGWKLKKSVINMAVTLVIPLIAYGVWFLHLDAYRPVRREGKFDLTDKTVVTLQPEEKNDGKSSTVSSAEEKAEEEGSRRVKGGETSIKAIFIPALRTDRYNEILDEMKWYFVNNHETIFSTDIVLIGILFMLGTVAAVCRDREKRIGTFLISAGLTAGCFVYNIVIAYQMQFYNDMMVEYPRYMVSYYFGWMYVILILFAVSPNIKAVFKQGVLALVMAVTLFDIYKTGLEYTVFDAPENAYQFGRAVTEKTEFANSVLKAEDRVYIVYKDQDGLTYIRYRYNLLPAYSGFDTQNTGIDFSVNFREKLDYKSDRQYYNIASPRTFTQVMKEYFDYIFVVEPDDEFYNSYTGLFSDGMSKGTLYRVTDNEIPMQAVSK